MTSLVHAKYDSTTAKNQTLDPNVNPGPIAEFVITNGVVAGLKDPLTGATLTIGGSSPYTSTVNVTVTTSATPNDASFVAFSSQVCDALFLDNVTKGSIDIQRGGSGAFITLPPGVRRRFIGLTNANQLAVRRSDYAVLSQTRTTTLVGQALVGGTINSTVSILSQAITNGGGWATFPSTSCVCLELINTCGKDILYRLNGAGSSVTVKNNGSVIIYGITNANQVGIQAKDQIVGFVRDPQAEVFGVTVDNIQTTWGRAVLIDDSFGQLGELSHPEANQQGFSYTPPMSRGRNTLTKKGKRILAQFPTVATITTNVSAQCVDATTGEFMFGQSCVEWTSIGLAAARFLPLNVLSVAIDVSADVIHFSCGWPKGSNDYSTSTNFSSFSIRLFSAGTPAAPSANYHECILNSDFTGGNTDPHGQFTVSGGAGNGCQIYSFALPISAFSATGAGATLTAILYAGIYFTCTAGAVASKFRPFEIASVPKARSVGSVIFTLDDLHIGQYTNLAPMLAAYNYPAVLCVDQVTGFVQASGSTKMTLENALSLQNNHGWQLTYQQYQTEVTINQSPEEFGNTLSKSMQFLLACGGGSGSQDTSYGTSTYANIDDERQAIARRYFRTAMTFKGGNPTNPPRAYGNQLPFADPYKILRLNAGGMTAGQYYNRWISWVDKAIAESGVAIFAWHSEWNTTGTEYFTAMASLLAQLRLYEEAGTCEVHTLDSLIQATYFNKSAISGTAVLVAGTVTVANTQVRANSKILVTSQIDGGVVGFLRISAKVSGTSFTITSSNVADTSTVAWQIL